MHLLLPTNEAAHNEIVEYADAACTRCGHCCHELGSIELIWRDLRKLSKHLKKTTTELVKEYSLEKRGGAWWLTTPCKFLEEPNKCTVYDVRPRVCRWFPMRLYLIRQNDPNVKNWIPICDALRATLEYFGGSTSW